MISSYNYYKMVLGSRIKERSLKKKEQTTKPEIKCYPEVIMTWTTISSHHTRCQRKVLLLREIGKGAMHFKVLFILFCIFPFNVFYFLSVQYKPSLLDLICWISPDMENASLLGLWLYRTSQYFLKLRIQEYIYDLINLEPIGLKPPAVMKKLRALLRMAISNIHTVS